MAENVGIYTDDSSMILKINQYNGYQELTCAQILEAIKNTDSANENAIGFVATPTNQEGYEIQPFNYTAGDLISIWNCFPDWTLASGDTNYIYWYVSNPTTITVRSRQYFTAIFSNNQWKFNSYRDSYFGSHAYDGITYYGKGSNSTSLSYSHAVLYISNLSAFTAVYFNGNPLVTYNWTSVPSVTGKNGTISLTQIASGSINDGEPVSDAAATAFSDLPAECNVGEIIDELLPYEESLVDVLVKYKVKASIAGAFSMLKLVAKAGKIPKSVEDGDVAVNINANKKSKLVTGLAEGTTYYFVIFAEDSIGSTAQSEPKKIKTGNTPPSEGKWEETISSSKALIDEFRIEFEETVTYEQIT